MPAAIIAYILKPVLVKDYDVGSGSALGQSIKKYGDHTMCR